MAPPHLHVGDNLPGLGLVPAPVQILCRQPELDRQIPGQILRLDLTAFLPPKPQQRNLIITHDDPGVGATDDAAAVM
jgi:hypothetical protein